MSLESTLNKFYKWSVHHCFSCEIPNKFDVSHVKMADFKMATMVTTHLEKFPPSHIRMCHKQEVNITNYSHFIKVYPYKWPTL